MSKLEKTCKTGFVIKLSNETVQKLVEEQTGQKIKAVLSSATVVAPERNKRADENKSNESTLPDHSQTTSKEIGCVADGSGCSTSKCANTSETKSAAVVNESEDKKSATQEGRRVALGDDGAAGDTSSWGEYASYVTYKGEEAIYTDPSTQHKYTWNKLTNSWDPKPEAETPGRVYSYEDDTHIYTEPDGSKSFWDVEKKAWIPKVDDDFLAFYQMSYGFVDNTLDPKKEENKAAKKKDDEKKSDPGGVKRKNDPQWFEPSEETNTKVYVSNLPQDLTEEEFVNFMQKCGLVERDPYSQKMKVKLYMDKEQNCFKGDALCTYIKIESVDLALKLLDGSDFKGNKIRVERAHFQLKGEYNPALKPKKKKKKELDKLKKMQQKLFDWRPEKFVGERSKHERVVIVKNLFHPSDFDNEVQLILDFQQDLREECGKCGDVRKVVIYDRHPEGVAQITMKEPEQADAVIQLINGRWFGKRQITAEIWDGRTKYKIAETDADISKRINKWDNFLEGKEGEEKNSAAEETTTTAVKVKDVVTTKSHSSETNECDTDKTTDIIAAVL